MISAEPTRARPAPQFGEGPGPSQSDDREANATEASSAAARPRPGDRSADGAAPPRATLWGIADQGLFSLANFGLNVLLARWLPQEQYGAFATAYGVLALVGTAHSALLTEPMLVFGPGKYRASARRYVRELLRGHCGALLLLGATIALAGLALRHSSESHALGDAVLAVGATAPFVLLAWLARRACHLHHEQARAAAASALYLLLLLGSLLALREEGALSPPAAFAAMGGAGILAGTWLLGRLGAPGLGSDGEASREAVWRDHWSYGRWALASGLLSWAPLNVPLLIIPAFHGLGASAALKALLNVALPVIQLDTAVAITLLPHLVRERGSPAFDHAVRRTLATLGTIGLAFVTLLAVAPELVTSLLYGGSYAREASLLWVVGLIALLHGLSLTLWVSLCALERPDRVFWGCLGSAACTASLGVWLTASSGVAGSLAGIVASGAVLLVVLGALYRRERARAAAQEEASWPT